MQNQEFSLQNDTKLNKLALNIVGYSAIAYTSALVFSIFFKRKSLIRNLSAGIGGGIGYEQGRKSFEHKQ